MKNIWGTACRSPEENKILVGKLLLVSWLECRRCVEKGKPEEQQHDTPTSEDPNTATNAANSIHATTNHHKNENQHAPHGGRYANAKAILPTQNVTKHE